ncbi:MAG: Gx transporter family protein [Clostridia bacterium]|nr:Gx transporter family protein [Clostridia bacterium]
MKGNLTARIALCAVLTALSTITFTLESLFPPIILPGARLGLSNIFILLSAILLGGKFGFITLVVKTIIGSLFAGNVSAIMYSLPAGVIALSIQLLILYYVKNTSIVCASVVGAVINTTVQNATFCIVTATFEYLSFLPYLAFIGVFSGIIVGFIVYLILLRMPTANLDKK